MYPHVYRVQSAEHRLLHVLDLFARYMQDTGMPWSHPMSYLKSAAPCFASRTTASAYSLLSVWQCWIRKETNQCQLQGLSAFDKNRTTSGEA